MRWGAARTTNLHWSMGDAERANEVLDLLQSRVSEPALRLVVDGHRFGDADISEPAR